MHYLYYYLYFLLSLVFLSSCTSLKENNSKSTIKNILPEDFVKFEKAFKDLGTGNYGPTIPVFEELAEKYQGQDIEQAALFNLASTYKELNQCKKAESVYKKLLSKIKQHSQLKARLYLSLSYVYECLGQADKVLITLREGMPYTHYLPEDIKSIEYPARLALAYIRSGEEKIGKEMQNKMYQNLEAIKKTFRITSAADKNFSRYFYTIGRSHIQADYIQLQSFLNIFPYYQTYLIQSILLKEGKWSIKAEQELGDLYRKLWLTLKRQKNKKKYQEPVQSILNQLRNLARQSNSQMMNNIYTGLRRKTKNILLKNF